MYNLVLPELAPIPTLEQQFTYLSSLNRLDKEQLIDVVKHLHGVVITYSGIINELNTQRTEVALENVQLQYAYNDLAKIHEALLDETYPVA